MRKRIIVICTIAVLLCFGFTMIFAAKKKKEEKGKPYAGTTLNLLMEMLKEAGRILPFLDGSTPEQVMAAVQKLSERFAEYRASAAELKGTGAHR